MHRNTETVSDFPLAKLTGQLLSELNGKSGIYAVPGSAAHLCQLHQGAGTTVKWKFRVGGISAKDSRKTEILLRF